MKTFHLVLVLLALSLLFYSTVHAAELQGTLSTNAQPQTGSIAMSKTQQSFSVVENKWNFETAIKITLVLGIALEVIALIAIETAKRKKRQPL